MYEFVGFIRRKGTSSKTGKPYDFYQCSFLFPYNTERSDCDGCEAVNINLHPDVFFAADMADHLGSKCNIRFSRFGRPEEVQIIK